MELPYAFIMTITYTFEYQSNGLVSITRSDGAPLTPAPRERLKDILGPHGFVQKDLDAVDRQLDEMQMATISIPVPLYPGSSFTRSRNDAGITP